MVDFRRWIPALVLLSLFVGLAGAQSTAPGGGSGPLVCVAQVTAPPQLRAEGITDLIGDIVITCTGGNNLIAAGGTIPTANITVSLQTNVTSRIIASNNLSEAMLLIDEPGTGLAAPVPGFGPQAGQIPCLVGGAVAVQGAGPGGCPQTLGITTTGIPVPLASGSTVPAQQTAANVFFGVVNVNQVTFFGVPVIAPVSAGTARVYRITNIRANVNGLGGGGLAGTSPLTASIAISGGTAALPISAPVVTAGFIQQGLIVPAPGAVRNANNTGNIGGNGTAFLQCNSANTSPVATLQFQEGFGTAFKTRVAPTGTYNGQAGSGAVNQNIPGTIYNSESGLIFTGTTGSGSTVGGISFNGNTPGLADFGTRLKATFNNIPSGVRLFVSTTNLAANTTSPTTTAPAQTSTSSYAVLVTGEATPDTNGAVPSFAGTTTVNSQATSVAEIPVTNGTATAVWEVVNTNPAAIETFNFGVWTSYSASPGTNSPAQGIGTVTLSFAPTSTVTSASASAPVPRFASTGSGINVIQINICQTLLLFPFVTNQAGFDTGIAIANTSTDPVGTGTQAGACTLTWYDGTGKTPSVNTGNIATGTVYTTLASSSAAGFQGYMFAQCNFQFAHGFAFISDLGARNLAMGYLALVVNNGGVTRSGAPASESLGN